MKKQIAVFILALGFLSQSTAQNYQTINSGRMASFQNSEELISFVRIDSVFYTGDSVFIPFQNIEELDYWCFTPFGTSWIGKKAIIKNNGINQFLNKEGDTIHIKTHALLNESWTAFSKTGLTIIATLSTHEIMSFIGLQDSVKTISFQAFDNAMSPITHQINGYTIKIAKNHGFVRTLNFSLFPDLFTDTWGFLYEHCREYDLAGLSDPNVGIQNLTWMEVYDFQPGDEIHVTDYQSDWFYQLLDIRQEKYRYLQRFDFSDSVKYKTERVMSRYFQNTNGATFTYTHDTIFETYTPSTNFDKLPGEPVIDSADFIAYALRMSPTWRISKKIPWAHEWIFGGGGDCWNPIIIDGCISDQTYYKGLGGPYHSCDLWGQMSRTLVYYKKGDETWGNPLIITSVNETVDLADVTLFPNPAKDKLWVTSPPASIPMTFEIFDTQGRMIHRIMISCTPQQIDLGHIPPGLYFCRMVNERGNTSTEKLIIR